MGGAIEIRTRGTGDETETEWDSFVNRFNETGTEWDSFVNRVNETDETWLGRNLEMETLTPERKSDERAMRDYVGRGNG